MNEQLAALLERWTIRAIGFDTELDSVLASQIFLCRNELKAALDPIGGAPPNPYFNWPPVGSTTEFYAPESFWTALTAEWLRLRQEWLDRESDRSS